MEEKIKKWLFDIYTSIEEIESFFESIPKDFKQYQNNQMLKRAVERNLEIIGEAVNRIIKQDSNIRIENVRSIISMRNFIIHSYDRISDENVWAVIIKHLPKLKNEVQKLLK